MHADANEPSLATPLRSWLTWMQHVATGRRGRWRQMALWLVVGLLVVRLLIPWVLTGWANAALAEGRTVRGSITGLSLNLLACNYTVHGLNLREQRLDGRWRPLLSVDEIHCDLTWSALLRGELAGEVTARRPWLHIFAEEPPTAADLPLPLSRPAPEPAAVPAWQDAIRTVVRVHLTEVDISDGRISYHDERRGIETELTDITVEIDELVIPEPALTHRCPFRLQARTPGEGVLQVDGEADVLAKAPTFLLRAQLAGISLPLLNPITKQIGNLSFADGTFEGYTEIVADGRRLGGYLKVLFHHLDVHSFGESDPDKGTVSFWGVVIELAEDILENDELHRHAARIPVRGELADPNTDVWTAIGTALRNAFISALAPGFERVDG